jgi:hypothetical protein
MNWLKESWEIPELRTALIVLSILTALVTTLSTIGIIYALQPENSYESRFNTFKSECLSQGGSFTYGKGWMCTIK